MSTDRERGFTLIELLLVIVVIGVLAAIAIPGLSRAQAASAESAAVGSLRAISSGQFTYASSCGGGFYAPSLAWLATPPPGLGDAFVSPDLSTDPSIKSGYTVTLTPGAPSPAAPASCNGVAAASAAATYFVGADPVGPGSHFGTNSGNTIYESSVPVVVTQVGLPPGSVPLN